MMHLAYNLPGSSHMLGVFGRPLIAFLISHVAIITLAMLLGG
jgi:hypothetical protein